MPVGEMSKRRASNFERFEMMELTRPLISVEPGGRLSIRTNSTSSGKETLALPNSFSARSSFSVFDQDDDGA